MIRPITCLSLLAALGAGGYLYQEKHIAQLLDRDINRTIKQADQGRDRIGLMKAEWALLNEPERLQGMAQQHLPTLQSLQPTQFARLEDLPNRLPAPSAAPVNTAPVVDAPVASVQPVAPIASRSPAMVAQAAVAQTTVDPAVVAPAPAAPVPVQLATARPKPHVAAKPRETEPALAAIPAPRPYYAPMMPAYAPTPVVIHAPTVQTASAMAAQPAPFVGSALGMARSMLAAPVPVATNATMGYANAR
jgi:hypothetical protein